LDVPIATDLAPLTDRFDVLIDFTRPAATLAHLALCRAAGMALVSTSANRAGRHPARTALEVRLRLGKAPDYLLNGPCGGRSQCSSIRDGRSGRLLRS